MSRLKTRPARGGEIGEESLEVNATEHSGGRRIGSTPGHATVHVDTGAGKRLFLDFWKLPFSTDENEDRNASILIGEDLTSRLDHALVLLPHEGEPALHRLGDICIFARVRPIERFPGHLDVLLPITDKDGKRVSAVLADRDRNVIYVPFFLDDVLSGFLDERYVAGRRTLLPSYLSRAYYGLKRYLPSRLVAQSRSLLARTQRTPSFPRWPLETSLEDFKRLALQWLLEVSKSGEFSFLWFWPRGKDFCVLLTHDVERSLAGNAGIDNLGSVERALHFKSSLNIVPFKYPLTMGEIEALRAEGFEIGVHGYSHDGRLFRSWDIFKERVRSINGVLDSWGATGFRSASTYRNPYWLNMLDLGYDSSFFDTDPYEPQPGGCLSLFPYLIGDIVELPLTMPQDYTLFVLLKERDVRIWLSKATAIRKRNGLICMVGHPDEGYVGDGDKVRHYVEFLEFLDGDDGMWNPLPAEAAEWWRARHQARLTRNGDSFSIESDRGDISIRRARLSEGTVRFDAA